MADTIPTLPAGRSEADALRAALSDIAFLTTEATDELIAIATAAERMLQAAMTRTPTRGPC